MVINTKEKSMDGLNYFHCKNKPLTGIINEIQKIRLINVILRRRRFSNMNVEVELKPRYLFLKQKTSVL